MTSKERVLMALRHEEADRVPLDIGGFNNTCMHEFIEREVKERLGLKDNGYLIKSRCQRITIPDESIIEHFGVDTCSIYINEPRPFIEHEDGTYTDMWGLTYKINPDGYYWNRINHPLADVEDIEDLDKYELPEPTPYMLEGLSERLDANKDKCCILEGLEEPMFGMPSWLRKNENFYADLIADPELCDALLEKLLAYFKKYIKYIMDPLGDRIDVVKVADDLGAQNAPLLSLELYRKRIKPFQAELYKYIKDNWNKPIVLHSCGAIRPFLHDLAEIGIDAINPVQISAAGMNPAELKKEFGDKLTFWGGGCDTQHVLRFGTVDDVRKMVEENIKIFKPNGGFIFCQVHNIQPETPYDNIMAMYDTYHKFCDY